MTAPCLLGGNAPQWLCIMSPGWSPVADIVPEKDESEIKPGRCYRSRPTGYVTPNQAARELCMSPQTVSNWAYRGSIPSIKIDGYYFIKLSDAVEHSKKRAIA